MNRWPAPVPTQESKLHWYSRVLNQFCCEPRPQSIFFLLLLLLLDHAGEVVTREQIQAQWFAHFLKDKGKLDLPEATTFESGTNRWQKWAAWPPVKDTESRSLFMSANKTVSFTKPTDASSAFDEYISDPAHPVPFTARITTGMPKEYMVEDQRFAATRPDVLVYQTEPLTEDVTFAGPITASLHVSTTGTDNDWVVKVIDVYTGDHPDSDSNSPGVRMGHYQQMVRGEPLRGKFRNSYDKPEAFVPGVIAKVEWVMPDVCHTFRTGHRIMVQIQSSWFPLLDRNPQTFCDIYRARAEDFKKATQRVYRTATAPSAVRVNLLPSGR
jgi:hypothetical protein